MANEPMLQNGEIPNLFRKSKIIAKLKSGKPANLATTVHILQTLRLSYI